MESNLMREWIDRPEQKSMRTPYVVNATFAYDSKHRRYVETEMDNEAAWYVSVAKPWSGDTIQWVDLATSTKPSRWEMTRIDGTTFEVRVRQARRYQTKLHRRLQARSTIEVVPASHRHAAKARHHQELRPKSAPPQRPLPR
jgi:hypothetical protein